MTFTTKYMVDVISNKKSNSVDYDLQNKHKSYITVIHFPLSVHTYQSY